MKRELKGTRERKKTRAFLARLFSRARATKNSRSSPLLVTSSPQPPVGLAPRGGWGEEATDTSDYTQRLLRRLQ